jgi:hypothetical protein
MADSSTDYDFKPVNHACDNVTNSSVIVSSPGSQTAQSSKDISNVQNQHAADAQYDNVEAGDVKPLYGGESKEKNILFTIKFLNKTVNILATDEKSAIKLFLNNKIYKKDNILEITHNKKSSLYIVKNGYKNKFVKCIS